jgi:diguanylate cyclase (GGDEF)-like protein
MLRSFNSFIADLPARMVSGLAVLLMLMVAAVDYLTGYEVSFSVFYLIPTSLAAWYGSRRIGYGMSLFGALTWIIIEMTSGQPYSQQWILFWNGAVRLVFFSLVAYLLAELKSHLLYERDLARSDNLTGLLNRAGFFERASVAVNAASRYGYSIAVAYIDLNGFKSINDNMGHSQGDRALQAVGALLGEASRGSDVIARFGGDEFVVLLPDTDLPGAKAYFEKRQTDLQRTFHEQGWTGLGSSIGAVVFEKAPRDISDALRRADDLMYRVKQSGKSGTIVERAASSISAAAERSASIKVRVL